MQSMPAHGTYATAAFTPPAWEAEAGSSVVQNDTAWLLSFIDILTLLLTLFVLLLAYDRNEQPATEMTLLAPRQAVENSSAVHVPMVETLETRYPLAMPLLVSDWFALLDPVTMSRADSIEALAGAGTAAQPPSDAEPATAAVAETGPAPTPLAEPAVVVAEAPAAPLPDTAIASSANYSVLPDVEAPMMSSLPAAQAGSRDVLTELQTPGAQAVLDILPAAPRQETAAAEILLEHFSAALRERVEISVATGVVNMEITDDILFKPASAALTDAGYALLDELATVLSDQAYVLSVEGHTDNVPIQTSVFPSNWELSSARAAIVTRSLIARGIAPDRIRAIGYGDTRPRADNRSAEGRARNRRVSFVLHVE